MGSWENSNTTAALLAAPDGQQLPAGTNERNFTLASNHLQLSSRRGRQRPRPPQATFPADPSKEGNTQSSRRLPGRLASIQLEG